MPIVTDEGPLPVSIAFLTRLRQVSVLNGQKAV
jgi:hypothetical protein